MTYLHRQENTGRVVGVRRILASPGGEAKWWAAIEEPPFHHCGE
ncbi:hypothetical protein [Streptomyces sp. NPDC021356]